MSIERDPFPPARSRDGRIEVRFSPGEVRMSIWIVAPTVFRTRDDRVVVEIPFPWDGGHPTFPRRNQVAFKLRRYPDDEPIVEIVVDVEKETWWPKGRPKEAVPASTLVETLEAEREERVQREARDYVREGICPDCKARTLQKPGFISRLLGERELECLICERRWPAAG